MNIYNYKKLIEELKCKGVVFLPGLTEEDFDAIKKTYSIDFPESLRKFYEIGVPTMENENENSFPQWTDYSQDNIKIIKERLNAPAKWLLQDVLEGFWIPEWGEKSENITECIDCVSKKIENAPRLIPVFSHRYIVRIPNKENPPVMSMVGSDIVCYGSNLQEYFCKEFLNQNLPIQTCLDIPFWGKIIDAI